MRHRALLANAASSASVALAVGSAGCLTTDGESTRATTDPATADTDARTDDHGERSDTESTTTAEAPAEVGPGDTVTVAGVDLDPPSLQSSFVERIWPTWNAQAPDDGLYAVLPVTASEAAPFLSDDPPLWATVDGDRWSDGGPTVTGMNAEDHPERFAVPVPTRTDVDDVDDVAIALGGTDGTVHYPLGDDHLATLRDPPDLAATATFPEETESRHAVEFALTVENTGGSAGTLAVAITHDNIYDKYLTHRVTADPEQSTTETFSIHPHAAPGETVETTVDWRLDTHTATVTVGDSTTTPDDDGEPVT